MRIVRRPRSSCAVAVMVSLLVVLASFTTASAASPSPERQEHLVPWQVQGGVLATFDVHGEVFRVWPTNPEAIQQLFALWEGHSTATIPIGPLRRGPGRAAHNMPWSWHFDPARFALADFTIELCDATPSYVEENLDYFIRTVRSYCPWAAVLVDLRDFRNRGWHPR